MNCRFNNSGFCLLVTGKRCQPEGCPRLEQGERQEVCRTGERMAREEIDKRLELTLFYICLLVGEPGRNPRLFLFKLGRKKKEPFFSKKNSYLCSETLRLRPKRGDLRGFLALDDKLYNQTAKVA